MALLLKASKVIEGNPEELVIESGQVIIGRLPSNHLVIPGGDVEPIHAMIELDGATGIASLVDMASEGGVKLNGRAVEVVEPIKVGDKIVIGAITIDVLESKPAPKAGEHAEQKADLEEAQGAVAAKLAKTQKSSRSNSKMDDYRYEGKVKKVPTVSEPLLFSPSKDRSVGSTLEVVAYWDQSLLDVRHFGGNVKKGEMPRPTECYIGNEEDGHMIGVGPRSSTRNLKLAQVEGSKTVIHLNDEMKVRVRRGSNFDKVEGPAKIKMSPGEMAMIKHGPVNYLLMNVSLPNPILKKFEDIDGRPFIFLYALLIYGLLSGGLWYQTKDGLEDKAYDEEAWAQTLAIRTPTPRPADKVPAPKPQVEVKKPEAVKPPEVNKPPEKKPEPVKEVVKPPEKKPEPVKAPVALQKPDVKVAQKVQNEQQANNKSAAAKGEAKNANDKSSGSKTAAAKESGNGGGKTGGTAGANSGKRAGNQKSSQMGVEGGKQNVMSGINLDKLGAGLGKISNIDGVGAIATGLQSSSGGAGAGSGSGARGSHGFGGIGGTNSLATGGPGKTLSGLGGGAGGLGAGGLGGSSGQGGPGGAGRKLAATSVVVPEGDPAIEGSLSKEEIEAVIRANLAQIKACYERFLQGNRDLAGRVTTNFVIGGDGRVTTAGIASSDLGSPGAESCITGAIRRWKFPLPRGGGVVQVKYPFVFNSR